MALEGVQVVLTVLRVIVDEWEDCRREDVEARQVSVVLATVIPKLKEWAKSKEQLSRAESQLIAALKQDADDIKSWLCKYKEEGCKNGFFARGFKMAKNLAKKAVGMETSYAALLELVGDMEHKLNTLQINVAFDIHAGVAQVLQKQQELMEQVQKRLQEVPSGLEVPSDTAKEIAELVGVDVARVVQDLRVDNRELWGQVDQKLDHIGAEVHETNLGVQELLRRSNLGGNVEIKNPEAAEFWKNNFMDSKTVLWDVFAAALEVSFSFDKDDLDCIRRYFDFGGGGDGHIDVVEFNVRSVTL